MDVVLFFEGTQIFGALSRKNKENQRLAHMLSSVLGFLYFLKLNPGCSLRKTVFLGASKETPPSPVLADFFLLPSKETQGARTPQLTRSQIGAVPWKAPEAPH